MAITSLECGPKGPMGDIGANVEALRLVGLVHARNSAAVTEEVTADFARLRRLKVPGELIVAVPQQHTPLGNKVEVLDDLIKNKRGRGRDEDNPHVPVPGAYVYDKLWTPDTERDSYTTKMLGSLGPEDDSRPWQAHGRLILTNPQQDPDTPVDLFLHHLGMPFDGRPARPGQETQLAAVSKQKQEFEARHPGTNLNALTASDLVQLALVRLIKGEPMPLEEGWGSMNDASLPRRTIDGKSMVGHVNLGCGEFNLTWSPGRENQWTGVGVSVGLNEA